MSSVLDEIQEKVYERLIPYFAILGILAPIGNCCTSIKPLSVFEIIETLSKVWKEVSK